MSMLSKATVPKLPPVHCRQRLINLIDQVGMGRALWIVAQPGAGKTTAVASYLANRPIHSIWYRCDEMDADPATFFHYLALAMMQATGHQHAGLPAFTPEYRATASLFARRFFREWFAVLPSPFMIVLDNYQDLGSDVSIHELIAVAIDELPDQGILCCVSRVDPPAAVSRMMANGLLSVIGQQDVRFTSDEAHELVKSRLPGDLVAKNLQRILEHAQGWAAGIVLLCTQQRPLEGEPETDLGDPQSLFNYFASEVFHKLDGDTRHILLATSVVPTLTADIAEQLSHKPFARQLLEHLYRNSYFTLRDSQKTPVYHYHPLFLAFLRDQAAKYFTDTEQRALRKKAVALLDADGQWEAALDLCRADEDWPALLGLLKSYGLVFSTQGRYAVLSSLLQDIEPAVMDQYPWLYYWRGLSNLSAQPSASQVDFNKAYLRLIEQHDASGAYRTWAGMVEALRSDATGDNQRLDLWVDRMDFLRRQFPDFPDQDIESDVAFSMFAALYHRAPQDPRLFHWKERAIELAMAGSNLHRRATVIQWAIIHDLLRGDHARAELYMTVFRSLEQASLEDPRVVSANRFMLAYYQARIGEFDQAIEAMDRGLSHAKANGIHIWIYQLLAHGTTAAIAKGDFSLSAKLLIQMEPLAQASSGFAPLYFHVLAAWNALLIGKIPLARQHAEQAVAVSKQANFVLFDGVALYGLAQVVFRQGDGARAMSLLSDALAIAQRIESRIFEHMCWMVKADFAYRLGDSEEGRHALHHGMSLGRQEKYINFTFWVPDTMARVCAEALAADIEADYARHIIQRRRLAAPVPYLRHWPWPVEITTLDHFAVRVDGKALSFTKKEPKRLLALLKAIIALGGRDVPAGRLADALWNGQDADDSLDAMDKALQRLRKLVGEDALVNKGGRVSLNSSIVWVDVWAFEHAGSQSGHRSLQQQAIALYRQNFLADEPDAPWTLPMRERLRSLFIRIVTTEARCLAAEENHFDAIECCHKALVADELAEEIYQQAIRSYIATNRKAEGLALFRRLRQTLSVTLGIAPSEASQILYRQLQ